MDAGLKELVEDRAPMRDKLALVKRALILDALHRFRGNISRSSAHLGVSRHGLRDMIVRLGLNREDE